MQNYMEAAIEQARLAGEAGEVPVGAVVVKDGKVIGRGCNERETKRDIFGHAEIAALKAASEALGSWRLTDCALYVTLEPCAMCAAACVEAQLRQIVFGAFDDGFGACGSAMDLVSGKLGRRLAVVGGVYEERCAALLTDFFKPKRRTPES